MGPCSKPTLNTEIPGWLTIPIAPDRRHEVESIAPLLQSALVRRNLARQTTIPDFVRRKVQPNGRRWGRYVLEGRDWKELTGLFTAMSLILNATVPSTWLRRPRSDTRSTVS